MKHVTWNDIVKLGTMNPIVQKNLDELGEMPGITHAYALMAMVDELDSQIEQMKAKRKEQAAQSAADRSSRAPLGLVEAVEEYIDGYELRADEGAYTPTELERFLITDAIYGVVEDADVLAALAALALRRFAGDHRTPFGLTYSEHLANAFGWLDGNRGRLHTTDCIVHKPDARCSCGLHRCITDVRAVLNDLHEMAKNGTVSGEKVANGTSGTGAE